MAKGFFKGLWDMVSGEEQAREEAEEQERRRQRAEQIAREEERARQQRIAAQKLKNFKDTVFTSLHNVEEKVQAGYNEPENDYAQVVNLEHTSIQNNWHSEYMQLVYAHRARLRKRVITELAGNTGVTGLCEALSAMSFLKVAEKIGTEESNDTLNQVGKAVDTLFQMVQVAFSTSCYLDFGDYGQCKFALDDSNEMSRMDECADNLVASLDKRTTIIKNSNESTLYRNINECLGPQYVKDACMLMWYYAKRWPFDVNAFDKARKRYLAYTSYFVSNPEHDALVEIGPLEEVLARVYAKKQIGGIGTARQEKAYIDIWLNKRIELGDLDPCYGLAHGLAWMELYELEIDILRRLIQAGADVPAELQDRLTFLENGGTEDIKVYDINPTDNIFFFDSSTPEWTNKDFATFFRKISMKKVRIQYSLALMKWTKTLPLSSGQKISRNQLLDAFKNLIEDFDGEISCEVRNAAAINVSNVVFPNAILFTFNSQRNRCVDILFYCEKFGRNLNITIFTLFTPDEKLDFEELERYCLAIKDNNMYVESFRESILQVVDETIKMKQEVYDDEDVPRKKVVFGE